MENKISAVIITRNEEKNIARCLRSLQQVADEIIVVDSGSTDNTARICAQYGAQFIYQSWLGYAAQKNYAARLAKYEFILSLDADEVLSAELIASINSIKQNSMADAYQVKRLTNYGGKWIDHCGWYPDKKIWLWRRNKVSWTTPQVHETITRGPNTTVNTLHGNLLHYAYYTIVEPIFIANKYTTVVAKKYAARGKKVTFTNIFISPVFSFFRDYLLRLGVLDGYDGFVICLIAAFATFLKYAQLKQLLQQDKICNPNQHP